MGPKLFRTSQMVGDLTRRKFGVKEVENMGCTLMGATLLSILLGAVLAHPGIEGSERVAAQAHSD